MVFFTERSAVIQKITTLFVFGFKKAPFDNVVRIDGGLPANHTPEAISFEDAVSEVIAGEQHGLGVNI